MMSFKSFKLHSSINAKQSIIEASGALKSVGIKANLQCLKSSISADNFFQNLIK